MLIVTIALICIAGWSMLGLLTYGLYKGNFLLQIKLKRRGVFRNIEDEVFARFYAAIAPAALPVMLVSFAVRRVYTGTPQFLWAPSIPCTFCFVPKHHSNEPCDECDSSELQHAEG